MSKIASGRFRSNLLTVMNKNKPACRRRLCKAKFASRTFHPHKCTNPEALGLEFTNARQPALPVHRLV